MIANLKKGVKKVMDGIEVVKDTIVYCINNDRNRKIYGVIIIGVGVGLLVSGYIK